MADKWNDWYKDLKVESFFFVKQLFNEYIHPLE